jgi:hypothetical protein
MKVKSYQLAFGREDEPLRVRPIKIPEGEARGASQDKLLGLAYHYGQNDFQPSGTCYSVSVGDVIELADGSMHLVLPFGFRQLPAGTDPEGMERGPLAAYREG